MENKTALLLLGIGYLIPIVIALIYRVTKQKGYTDHNVTYRKSGKMISK